MFGRLLGTKTFWAALGLVVVAFGAQFSQSPEAPVAWLVTAQAVGMALVGLFIRDGIAKK